MELRATPGSICCAALVACALLSAGPLRAQGDAATDQAKVHYVAATEAFKGGDYATALVGYQKAYEAKPLPALLFNIGQCFYNLGKYEEAREAYRRYLASGIDDTSKREAVEQMLAEADRKIAEARPPREPDPPPPPPPEVATTTTAGDPPPPVRVEREDAGMPVWVLPAIAGGALAVAGVAVGVGVLAVWAATPAPVVLPSGSVGTLDRRGAS